MRTLLLLLAAFLSVALVPARLTAASPATVVDAVAATTQAWANAFNSRDPERVLALYETDAVLWGTSSPTLRNTPESRREYFSNMPSRPDARVRLGEQHVRVFGDTAVNSGTYTFSNTENGQTTSTAARFSFTYRFANGRWMIVDHHSSAIPPPRN